MPTIPSQHGSSRGPGRPEAHHARQIAESFGTDAERYDRARPGYPDALVNRIVAASPGRDVLDVGCGTGISSRLLAAAGCRVLGIDPDARMADRARRSGLTVEVARFEDWDPAGRSFDAVVSGQAWHWVDPVAGVAAAARVLRPGGRVAVFWNAFQPPPSLNEAFGAVYRRVLPDMPLAGGMPGPDVYMAGCEKTADCMRQAGAFGEPEYWRFDWERPYTRDEWLEVVPTFGGHAQLLPATMRELLDGIGAVIDAAGGSFMMGYATVAVSATRSTAL